MQIYNIMLIKSKIAPRAIASLRTYGAELWLHDLEIDQRESRAIASAWHNHCTRDTYRLYRALKIELIAARMQLRIYIDT